MRAKMLPARKFTKPQVIHSSEHKKNIYAASDHYMQNDL
jgi:hypothetical protein